MARRKYNVDIRDIANRNEKHKNGKKIFMIACEGTATEPKYLRNMINVLRQNKSIGAGSDIIFAKHKHSNPTGVLSDLISDPRYSPSYNCWIVIDRDDKENLGNGAGGTTIQEFNAALQKAEQKGVKVAFSNPCFELWIVLHFKYRETAVSRKEIQKTALDILREHNFLTSNDRIQGMKTLDNLYECLLPYVDTAIKHAKTLDKKYGKTRENPCTHIYKLVEEIRDPN